MGFSPNPLISALMATLHYKRRRSDPCRMGWMADRLGNSPESV
jgi:hypothetical protein